MPIRERKVMTVEMDHPLVQEIESDEELVEFGRAAKQSATIFKDKGFDEVAEDLMALAESCGVKKPGRKPGSKNKDSGSDTAAKQEAAKADDSDAASAAATSGANGSKVVKVPPPAADGQFTEAGP